MSDRPL